MSRSPVRPRAAVAIVREYIKIIVIVYYISDVNECSANYGNCSQLCTNTNGSYVCSCNLGYQLSADSRTCNGNQLFIGGCNEKQN